MNLVSEQRIVFYFMMRLLQGGSWLYLKRENSDVSSVQYVTIIFDKVTHISHLQMGEEGFRLGWKKKKWENSEETT